MSVCSTAPFHVCVFFLRNSAHSIDSRWLEALARQPLTVTNFKAGLFLVVSKSQYNILLHSRLSRALFYSINF